MYSSFISLATPIFTIIVLLLSIIITSHISFGLGTKKARDLFIVLLLILIIGVQAYYIISAATFIPSTRFFVLNTSLQRSDCLNSGKGGKRPKDDKDDRFLNPCFCNVQATCLDASGSVIASASCPTDGSASCVSKVDGSSIPLYLDQTRNCQGGMNRKCSKLEPCFPCEQSRLQEFGGIRCASCTAQFSGDCGFLPDVGPYCYKYNSSKEIEPCKTCCTDPTPFFVNGKCI